MLITISINAPEGVVEQDILSLDVGTDMTINDLKAVIQSDTNIPPPLQMLYYNGQALLDNAKTLGQIEIKEGDMLGMHVQNPQSQGGARRPGQGQPGRTQASGSQGSSSGGPARQRQRQTMDPELIRLRALSEPVVLDQLRQQSPVLAEAVQNQQRFRQVWDDLTRQEEEAEAAKQREIALLHEDPFNIEAQQKIEEIIRQEAVMENLQTAMDYNPEGSHLTISNFGANNTNYPPQLLGRSTCSILT